MVVVVVHEPSVLPTLYRSFLVFPLVLVLQKRPFVLGRLALMTYLFYNAHTRKYLLVLGL